MSLWWGGSWHALNDRLTLLFCLHARRPFLEFRPVSGSFQANPPYCEELIEAALLHIERLLSDSIEPLRYVLGDCRRSHETNW